MRPVIQPKNKWALIEVKDNEEWVHIGLIKKEDAIRVEQKHAAYFETYIGIKSCFGVFDSVIEAFAYLDNQVNKDTGELAEGIDELYDYLFDSIFDNFDYELKRKEKNKWLVKTDDVEREFTWKRKAKIEIMRQAEKQGKLNFRE